MHVCSLSPFSPHRHVKVHLFRHHAQQATSEKKRVSTINQHPCAYTSSIQQGLVFFLASPFSSLSCRHLRCRVRQRAGPFWHFGTPVVQYVWERRSCTFWPREHVASSIWSGPSMPSSITSALRSFMQASDRPWVECRAWQQGGCPPNGWAKLSVSVALHVAALRASRCGSHSGVVHGEFSFWICPFSP